MTTTFKVKKPVDFIALSPVMLGFYPNNSVVMLTMGKFCARVDVPPLNQVGELIDALLPSAKRHEVKQAALLVFEDGDNADILRALSNAFNDSGIEVVAALEVHDNEFCEYPSNDWQPFELEAHPFTLEARMAGITPHLSREALWETCKPLGVGWEGEVSLAVAKLRVEGLMNTVMGLSRSKAKEQLVIWKQALQGAEPDSAAAANIALVLAYAFWLAGDGAGAWLALDVADTSSEHHNVMSYVLNNAINPATWPTE